MDNVAAVKRRTWSLDTKVILAVLFSFLGGRTLAQVSKDDLFKRGDHYHWGHLICSAAQPSS